MEQNNNNGEEYDVSLNALLLSVAQLYPALLNAAIELNLFKIIGEGSPKGMSTSEIASKLPNPSAETSSRLDRLLFLLTTHSLLTCSGKKLDDGSTERLYALSPTGKYICPDEDGVSYASMSLLNYHPSHLRVRENMKQVILQEEGDLFKIVHGISVFEYMKKDPTLDFIFHKAMADISYMLMNHIILKEYKGFEGISTLVDVAGGIGQSLQMIVSKYPSIQGINFDLPHVVQQAPTYSGIKHVGGNMFESVPEGDAIMVKATTHNWADDKCIQILKNCYKSLKKGGKLIIIEIIKPEIPTVADGHKLAAIVDCMMFQLAGGKERTLREFEALGKAAGFSSYSVAASVFSSSWGVIEFYK